MHRETRGGLVIYRFEGLPAGRVSHAVFTRLGGVSKPPFATLNVGSSVGDDPAAVAQNHALVYRCMEIQPEHVTTAYQVHGNHVAVVTAQDGSQVSPKTDGLVTSTAGLGLMLRFADCQPILLYDPVRHALGLFHAGWRGVAQGMARRAVEGMQHAFGSTPRDLLAALGPAIGPCCYEVGDNVATAMGYSLPSWRKVLKREGSLWRFDLSAANAQQLTDAGVGSLEEAGICTCCHSDEFYSHRAEHGRTGRFAVLAYLHQVEDGGFRPVLPELDVETLRDAMPSSIQPAGLPPLGGLAAQDSGGQGNPGGVCD